MVSRKCHACSLDLMYQENVSPYLSNILFISKKPLGHSMVDGFDRRCNGVYYIGLILFCFSRESEGASNHHPPFSDVNDASSFLANESFSAEAFDPVGSFAFQYDVDGFVFDDSSNPSSFHSFSGVPLVTHSNYSSHMLMSESIPNSYSIFFNNNCDQQDSLSMISQSHSWESLDFYPHPENFSHIQHASLDGQPNVAISQHVTHDLSREFNNNECYCCGCSSVESRVSDSSISILKSAITVTFNETLDVSADISTTAIMQVDSIFYGSLQSSDDKDWVAVNLESGNFYEINLFGYGDDGVSDTYLSIYDQNGNLLEINDDGGVGLNSSLVFSGSYSGKYYIEASSYASSVSGDYQLMISSSQAPSPTSSLVWQNAEFSTSSALNVYFALTGETVNDEGYTIYSDGFSDSQINNIMGVFSQVSSFSNIRFDRTYSQQDADIQLAVADLGSGLLGFMYPQGSSSFSDGLGVFTSDPYFWNDDSLQVGGFMHGVIVHEIGHGLGLAHPHDTGGGSDVMTGVSSSSDTGGFGSMNQSIYTVMSYNDGWQDHPLGASNQNNLGFMSGFAALDIAVLQSYYGVNQTYNSGDNEYLLGDQYYQTIWDSGGIDEISALSSDSAVIDLRSATLNYEVGGAGYVSYLNESHGGFTIAADVIIENARGGAGDDIITGNEHNNTIYGMHGNDIISGGDGDDVIMAGQGDDVITGGMGSDEFIFYVDDGVNKVTDFDLDVDSLIFYDSNSDLLNQSEINLSRSDDGYRFYSFSSNLSVELTGVTNYSPTGSATIQGDLNSLSLLQANISDINDRDGIGVFSFQWYRDGVGIKNATNNFYQSIQEDVGTIISYVANYTDDFGVIERVYSNGVMLEVSNFSPVGTPVIVGEMIVGSSLEVDVTSVSDSDGLGLMNFSWYRGEELVSESPVYTLSSSDIGGVIRVVVSYVDGKGNPEQLFSDWSDVITHLNFIPTGKPSIVGDLIEGSTLTLDTSSVFDSDGMGEYAFSWYREDEVVSTESFYELSQEDVGYVIRAKVSYIDGFGTFEELFTDWSSVIVNVNNIPDGLPLIIGTFVTGEILTVDTSLISDIDGLGEMNFVWYRNDDVISTEDHYELSDLDIGSTIRVAVSYRDDYSTLETIYSESSPVIESNEQGVTIETIDVSADVKTEALIWVGSDFYGSLYRNKDIDWVAVDLMENQQYDIHLIGYGRDGVRDTFLKIYNDKGQLLSSNDDGGEGYNSFLQFTSEYSGRFFIESSSYRNSSKGDYVLSVAEVIAPVAVVVEYADAVEGTATAYSIEVSEAFAGSLSHQGDRDWIAVSLEANYAYEINLYGKGNSPVSDTFLRLYDENGLLDLYDDDSGDGYNSSLSFVSQKSGLFFVEADSYMSSYTGDYMLEVVKQSEAPIVTINELVDAADGLHTEASMPVESLFYGSLDYFGDRDWIQVDLSADQSYDVNLSGVGSLEVEDTFLRIYDQYGARVAKNDDDGQGLNSALTFTPNESGVYYLEAASYRDGYVGDYQLSLNESDYWF